MPRFWFAFAALGFLASAPPAMAAPQCVSMIYLDKNGVVIPLAKPIVGIVLGGRPHVESEVPAGATPQAGAPAPCTPEILKSAQDLFDASCLTEDRRVKAARENKADRKIIDNGCRDLLQALKP